MMFYKERVSKIKKKKQDKNTFKDCNLTYKMIHMTLFALDDHVVAHSELVNITLFLRKEDGYD